MFSRVSGWPNRSYAVLALIILLIAAVLRLYGLTSLSPPGLEHDEVAHWLINRDILAGNHGVYFIEAYGHEAGFHYVQTAFMLLLGDNALALRLPAAFAGLLLVATNFALTRRLFDIRTAVLSAALLAILFWPVFYSRLALRAISLPLLSGASAYFWWSGWQSFGMGSVREPSLKIRQRLLNTYASNRIHIDFALAGLLAGLTIYTYMASRVVPIFYALFALYLAFFHRQALRRRARPILLFFLIYAVVAMPLIVFLLSNPGAEFRISEVNAPLLELMNGNIRPVLDNSLKFLGMFGFRGDPLWRQNVAFLPVFEPILAILFYIGLLITLWRWRKPRYLFLLLWLFTASIPSILTIDAPSSIRIINVLPILTIFPVLGLEVIHFLGRLSTVSAELSPKAGRKLFLVLLLALLVVNIARTALALFQTWPSDSEVQFVWQQALAEAAAYLDSASEGGAVAVGGWTPETMDPATMELALRREDLTLRYFDPSQSLVVPADDEGEAGANRIIRPAILPLEPWLEARLGESDAVPQHKGDFVLYELTSALSFSPQYTLEARINEQLTFLGYDSRLASSTVGDAAGNQSIELITYWRVEEPADGPRSVFLHLIDENEGIVSQDDGLGVPSAHWRPGDVLMQRHSLAVNDSTAPFTIRLGLYNPITMQRFRTDDGADSVTIDLNLPG